MIWDSKSTFINNSMIIPLQPKLTTTPRTWSGLLFTKLQVHLVWTSPLNLLISSMEVNGLNGGEGANAGMLSQFLTKGSNTLGKEGK